MIPLRSRVRPISRFLDYPILGTVGDGREAPSDAGLALICGTWPKLARLSGHAGQPAPSRSRSYRVVNDRPPRTARAGRHRGYERQHRRYRGAEQGRACKGDSEDHSRVPGAPSFPSERARPGVLCRRRAATREHDDKLELHDALTGLLVSSTPHSVLRAVAQKVREDVSIKSGDAAATAFDDTQSLAVLRDPALWEYRTTALSEHLRGDCALPTRRTLAESVARVAATAAAEPTADPRPSMRASTRWVATMSAERPPQAALPRWCVCRADETARSPKRPCQQMLCRASRGT